MPSDPVNRLAKLCFDVRQVDSNDTPCEYNNCCQTIANPIASAKDQKGIVDVDIEKYIKWYAASGAGAIENALN